MEAAPIPVAPPHAHDRAKLSNLPRLRGMDLLDTPLFNKGTAFSYEERTRLGLHALLPPQVETLEQQVVRAYEAYERKTDDLERHIYLRALQDNNEVLFYRLLLDHLEEMTPVVYTPVVASGCQEFSHIYRRPRGLFLSYPLRESLIELLRHRPNPEVDVIVVTDGERILGIGDQGAGGLGIPIGKLSLYTLFGGIAPERTLPIVIDVGTNNPDRLKDPEYLGWRHDRITGPDYNAFIDQFVRAVKQELPGTLLQWEDFGVEHARPILEKYRDQMLTFNDDIQGTGAVTLAVVLAASEVTGVPLKDQRLAILGAGSAGIGVADLFRSALVEAGLSETEARQRCWLVNRGGLLHSGRTDLRTEQMVYAQPWEDVKSWAPTGGGKLGLEEVVREAHPTVLVGLSTLKGAFTESMVRSMARWVSRPLILPLSNPTVKSEAIPEDLIRWTEGRAIVATGSPFPPIEFNGTNYHIAQCNNAYIFPALGLGLVAGRCRRATDSMLLAAARSLAEHSPARENPHAPLLPTLRSLRSVAEEIALAVAREGQRRSLAPSMSVDELRVRIRQARWEPEYPLYA
ncbi:MAG: NAD-dependent malic enzyme [Thermoplasmata archaeon]|jgi:malate dehydrogenase (oxaloacetate-decarboxylating)